MSIKLIANWIVTVPVHNCLWFYWFQADKLDHQMQTMVVQLTKLIALGVTIWSPSLNKLIRSLSPMRYNVCDAKIVFHGCGRTTHAHIVYDKCTNVLSTYSCERTTTYSENDFAICFLLEISLGIFPFQMKSSDKHRIPKNDKPYLSKDFMWKGSPLRGISSRRHIANILSCLRHATRRPSQPEQVLTFSLDANIWDAGPEAPIPLRRSRYSSPPPSSAHRVAPELRKGGGTIHHTTLHWAANKGTLTLTKTP